MLPALNWGWGLLFYSMAASLLLMFSMIIATFHMGVRWRKKLEAANEDVVFVATWPWLRIVNAILGVSILCSCVIGIAFMAYVAHGVASAFGAVTSTAGSIAVTPVPQVKGASNTTVNVDARKSGARPSP